MKKICWFSCGVTSAVACKLSLDLYKNVDIVYIHISSSHSDNARFINDCEEWYNKKIITIKSDKYKDQFELIKDKKAINFIHGAPCTTVLKKEVRYKYEINGFSNQIFGFEYSKKEINRAIRFGQEYGYTNPLFPLIEKGLTKNNCASILRSNKIELPQMYKLGYSNNNCIGCVKGGAYYWNRIRNDFPNEFNKMLKLENEINHSCINGTFLKDLKPGTGVKNSEVLPDCGNFCNIELENIEDKNLVNVMFGKMSIYDAIKNRNFSIFK